MRSSDLEQPIAYLPRIATYYKALGFGEPYRFAHFDDVPFCRREQPLADSCVALLTTAALYRPELGDQGPGAPYNAAAKYFTPYSAPIDGPADVRISHIAYDRTHTSAEDPGCWFPLAELQRQAAAGRIGSLAPRFHGVPTNRSQRITMEVDAPQLLARLREDRADAAVLVANCPVCHQSVSLVARHLEANGIATVMMGCAKDIVELVGVPRFLFSDFPLGNAAGRPHDPESQQLTLALALDLLEEATTPRMTRQSPLRWSESSDWKLDYCNIERLSAEDIARLRREFDESKSIAAAKRRSEVAP